MAIAISKRLVTKEEAAAFHEPSLCNYPSLLTYHEAMRKAAELEKVLHIL